MEKSIILLFLSVCLVSDAYIFDGRIHGYGKRTNMCTVNGYYCIGHCKWGAKGVQFIKGWGGKMGCLYTHCCTGYRAEYQKYGGKVCVKDDRCFPTLIQHASKKCQQERQLEAKLVSSVYRPIKVSQYLGGKLPLTDMTFKQAAGLAAGNPEGKIHLALFNITFTASQSFLKAMTEQLKVSGKDNLPSFTSYVRAFVMLRAFVEKLRQALPNFHAVSDKTFLRKLTTPQFWQSDKYFTQQRLAGGNPYILRRVHGWSRTLPDTMSLTQFLSDVHPYIRHVVSTKLKMSLEKAVKKNLIYVADHEEMRGWVAVEDFPAIKGLRNIRKGHSPIAIFASVEKRMSWHTYNELEVIAIQTSYGNTNKLVTPGNTYEWALAKLEFQMVDNIYTTVIEHLYENHFRMEHYCLASKRAITHLHPLHGVFEAHCRGLLLVNKAASLRLLKKHSGIDLLTSPRTKQMGKLALNRIKKWKYGSGDIMTSMKNRGVLNRKLLPYYPARDDGELIMNAVKSYAEKLVNSVYHCDSDLIEDKEMQVLVNSLSANGIPEPHGLKGTIVGMPPHFKTRKELADFLTIFIGMTVRQNSITSSFLDFASSTYLMPTKLYNPLSRVSLKKPSDIIYNLPNGITVATQVGLAITMGTLHLDHFLDYSSLMPTPELKEAVMDYYKKLQKIGNTIKNRNDKRKRIGHLPYFNLIPRNMVNSIST